MDKYAITGFLDCNPTLDGLARLSSNIVYSTETGVELTMDLLLPWNVAEVEVSQKKHPLIVFVQGSAWTTPDREFEIPQLSAYAREGYVVATVGHRDYTKGYPFPAYLQDVKCAIRFLRKNADVYRIDSDRVAIWGTSSGGNTALLVGLTADDPRYETNEYTGYSDAVKAVVSCFGPTDIQAIAEERKEHPDFLPMLTGLFGPDPDKWEEGEKEMSPVCHVKQGKKYPPFLLLNGDKDQLVNYSQMETMYHKLIDCGASAEAWRIEGAVHEGNFWSSDVHEVIGKFLKENL